MASTEGPARAHGRHARIGTLTLHKTNFSPDRHARRRPFAAWMKRLANLKSLHADSTTSRVPHVGSNSKSKKANIAKNSPYALSQRVENLNHAQSNSSTPLSSQRSRHSSLSPSKHSVTISHDSQIPPKSRAPTTGTTADTIASETARSGAGTSATIPRTEGDRDSTFSSPAPSLRSMTTTLTTMQSTTPAVNTTTPTIPTGASSQIQPASAVPSHLVPHNHPATYHSATANNVLTDDASILTLASSSKRRRRNSLDTNASIRALAPASMFGGSRESLPLSVLSGTIIHPGQSTNAGDNASFRDTASSYYPRSTSAFNAERASLISASGVTAPALTSERNSYISNKPAGDGASVRSGLLNHGVGNERDRDRPLYHSRNDSCGGASIGRDRYRDREDAFKEREMVTAPTSPMPA